MGKDKDPMHSSKLEEEHFLLGVDNNLFAEDLNSYSIHSFHYSSIVVDKAVVVDVDKAYVKLDCNFHNLGEPLIETKEILINFYCLFKFCL